MKCEYDIAACVTQAGHLTECPSSCHKSKNVKHDFCFSQVAL
jgi:hypothetical protein